MLLIFLLVLLNFRLIFAKVTYYPAAYESLDCWTSKHFNVFPSAEDDPLLGGNQYKQRELAISKCARVAARQGKLVFAIQDGGKCLTLCKTLWTQMDFGDLIPCPDNGKGSSNATHVYKLVKVAKVQLENLGCWRDEVNSAIPTIEGQDPVLDGPYKQRKEAIAKCVQATYKRGFTTLALQYGGWCATSATANETYSKYGQSSKCHSNGKGGGWSNQVYKIRPSSEVHFPGL